MEIAGASSEWATGFEDECWWSREALPTLNAWAEEGEPLRLVGRSVAKDDPEPKAISCHGLYLPALGETWIRFVDGRPVSSITTQFLGWCAEKLEAAGKKVLLLIWDNASWQVSKEVRRWLGKHNREVKDSGEGVRIVSCLLPKRSPWLNPIEPKWVHGKRKVVEADGLLGAYELAERVCRVFDCPHHEHLAVPQNVARSCIRCGEIFYHKRKVCSFGRIRAKLRCGETQNMTLVGNSYEAPDAPGTAKESLEEEAL